ncbi:hypothetical protein [Sphingomonas montana]|uniref:hypothetical protein n=1 Tax=Sphingomonas montana TaxID=1843236 RepID=UPI00096DFAF8|nr:hypothetical protein [Sphingomonas montana]
MSSTIVGTFDTRRAADIAVEHLVQEYGLDRAAILVAPVADENSVGTKAAGADVESGHTGVDTDAAPALAGALTVTVEMHADEVDAVTQAFNDAGATKVARG